MYPPRDMVCPRNMCMATLHKGKNDDDATTTTTTTNNNNNHHHLPPWIRSFDLFRHRRVAIFSWGVHDLFSPEVCSWGRVSEYKYAQNFGEEILKGRKLLKKNWCGYGNEILKKNLTKYNTHGLKSSEFGWKTHLGRTWRRRKDNTKMIRIELGWFWSGIIPFWNRNTSWKA